MLKYVFMDMDGTLLNMKESEFEKNYLGRMVMFMERHFPGEGKNIVKAVGYGGEKMKTNDRKQSNEVLFWKEFEKVYPKTRAELEPLLLEFYDTEFCRTGDGYVENPDMKAAMELLNEKGYGLVVATNPLVPQVANKHRLEWCTLDTLPWLEVTSFEKYTTTKPMKEFYGEICEKLGLNPQEAMMVGNSVKDDAPAMEIGMDFFLMLNEDSDETSLDYEGKKGYRKDFLAFVQALPNLK